VSDAVVPSAQPRRSWVETFFGVIARLQTWKNMAYLALAFPLGLFYLVFLVVGLALGVGLVIIWVGLPILAVVVLAWWAFAGFERLQAEHLLGVRTAGRLAPWEGGGDESWWQRVKRHLGDARTWKDLAFLFVKFPMGVVSFVIVTVVVAVPTALIAAPLYYRYAEWTTNEVHHYGISFGTWHIDTLGEALLLVPIGLIVLLAGLHLANVFARFSGILAAALLDETGAAVTPPQSATPLQPPAAPAVPPETPALPPEMPEAPPETSTAPAQASGAASDTSAAQPRWSGAPWVPSTPSPQSATPLPSQAPEAPTTQAVAPQAPQPVPEPAPQPPVPPQAGEAPEARQ
jgi:hypothetical protein